MLDETIQSIEYGHGSRWIILTMKSGRRFEIDSDHHHLAGPSLSWSEIQPDNQPAPEIPQMQGTTDALQKLVNRRPNLEGKE